MLGFNRAFIMGNLTRDPELRYTPNGQAVASFGVATNRRWTTPEGERRDEVEFHNIVVWGRQAETINQYLKKGQPIFVEGRLKSTAWEGPDGVRRSRTEIIVESFQFIGSGGGQAGGGNPNYNQQQAPANNYNAPVTNQSPANDLSAVMPSPSEAATYSGPSNAPMANDDPFATPTPPTNTPTPNPDDINIDDIPF